MAGYTDEQLATMSQGELLDLRRAATSQEEQNRLAGFEHRAFQREDIAANPERAPGAALLTVGYTAAKAVGAVSGRSEPSIQQMGQGLTGIAEGVVEAVKKPWEKVYQKAAEVVRNVLPEGGMPWEKTWQKADNNPGISLTPSKKLSPSIDTIYSNLLTAESNNMHVDNKTGELIKSSAGAEGISQLRPSTAKNPGFGIEPVKDKSKEEYLRVGKEYLQALYDKFGDWEKAVAAYNAGPGSVDKAIGKGKRFGGDWKEHLPKKDETLPYLQKILGGNNA